jgi:hypothetical protein
MKNELEVDRVLQSILDPPDNWQSIIASNELGKPNSFYEYENFYSFCQKRIFQSEFAADNSGRLPRHSPYW